MKLRCWNNEICRVSALKLEFLVVVKLKEISASGIEKSKGKKMEGHPWASWPLKAQQTEQLANPLA